MGWTRNYVMLGASSSTLSSAPIYVGDAAAIAASIVTSTTSASNVTFRGSNADGFRAAIPDHTWSVLTAIPNAGNYTIEPGVRWLLAERRDIAASAASNATILLAIRVPTE